jgi:hypothetical protein
MDCLDLVAVTFSLDLVAVTFFRDLLWPAALCGDNVKNLRAEMIR